ncbi:MAG: hypothetical protein JWN25_967 [Verrucomicrobiales bacterium]|nr:hypothetical protein [Verrucomicrobiales bacterium]
MNPITRFPLRGSSLGRSLLLLFVVLGCLGVSAADLESDVRAASEKANSITAVLERLAEDGEVSKANDRLLALFPEATRTPAETLMLGNMLYNLDSKLSYALHKEAFGKLPHEPLVLMEWAMEQQRAGEYNGALQAYNEYSRTYPEYAPVHGLAADCLIRLGKTKEAVARWKQSENASLGTLVELESLVCAVYFVPGQAQRRATLRAAAQKGDVDAAVRLIALDGRFERDWWNNGPQRSYLARDLAVLRKMPPSPRIKAALCVGDCLLPEQPTKTALLQILVRHGFLVDPDKTLPADGALASLLLGVAMDSKVMGRAQAREEFGAKLLASGKASKDAELLNIAANLNSGTAAMEEIEKQAWELTGDRRFAAGYLIELLANKKLKPNDPLLDKAMKQFPEDATILYVAIQSNPSPSQELLVSGIKAEYRHFSASTGLLSRPGAQTLRSYFKRLEKLQQ